VIAIKEGMIMTEEKETRPPKLLSGKKIKTVLLGLVIVILVISASLNLHYYNLSQTLTNSVEGSTLEVSREFSFCMDYVTLILDSKATPENIYNLIRNLQYHLQTAWGLLRTLRIYLIPAYEKQLQIIEDLLINMTVQGYGGVSDVLWNLNSQGNVTLLIQAFQELNATASQKINDVGFELSEAFDSLRRDGTVVTFNIIPSRIENSVNAANELKGILNEWITKYSS